MVQLVGGGTTPFEAAERLQVPSGRDLTLTASSLGSRDSRSGAVMRTKVDAAVEVHGTLRLIGVEVFSKGERRVSSGPSFGSAPSPPDSSSEGPLVTIQDGGTVEIIQSELHVVAGESAIDSFRGRLVLRETTITSERSGGGGPLLPSSDVSPPDLVPLVHLRDGSHLELGTNVRLESQDAATWGDMLHADSKSQDRASIRLYKSSTVSLNCGTESSGQTLAG